MELTLRDATVLAHLLCAQIGRERRIRVLSMKGVVSEHYRFREPRAAADADVLIEPRSFDEFCLTLMRRGWHERVGPVSPTVFTVNGRTFIHDDWPCDIDVHSSFYGLFARPEEAFEQLWATRRTLIIGGGELVIPSRQAAALLTAVHAERSPRAAQRWRLEADRVRHILTTEATDADRAEFSGLVTSMRSSWILREFLRAASLGEAHRDISEAELRLWTMARAAPQVGTGEGWLMELRDAPWRKKLFVIKRAIWVPRRDIPRNDADSTPSFYTAWAYRFQRWHRGFTRLLFVMRSRL